MNKELSGDLTEIPSIGPATVQILKELSVTYESNGSTVQVEGINSSFALIGVYLSFKSDRNHVVSSIEHAQRFYAWWTSIGTPAGFRAGVVHSIAEKVNISFPGTYDAASYGDL